MSTSYSEKEFNTYKERLASALLTDGIDADTINENSDYKTFISNYVDSEIVQKKHKFAILGITHKLAHMDINYQDTGKIYPIVNEYKGHDLQKTIYFSKGSNEDIIINEIPVKESKIITF